MKKINTIFLLLFYVLISCTSRQKERGVHTTPIYTYTLSSDESKEAYDEAMIISCLQGIINRDLPILYLLSEKNNTPNYWLNLFSNEDEWLNGRPKVQISDINEIFLLAKDKVKGAIIWDPEVPASMNIATTLAGIENGIVFSPASAEKFIDKWNLEVLKDFRGVFTGDETGSKKNDAYRWAIREYLSKGQCSKHWVCLFEDPFSTRERGDVSYVVTRDWAIKNKSFVYDLSPWGDEAPQDDPDQKMGTDLKTYKMMLQEILNQSKGDQMTEICGFFAFSKYSNMPDHKSIHDPVPTEWETVYLISPYSCYQNTVASNCFNQSFHSHATIPALKQNRPKIKIELDTNKVYICILMADYDSATPLYDFLPKFWDDEKRGDMPFLWGINPNLIETYPDIIEHYYKTRSINDYFGADASCAGYINPNRVKKEYLSLFIKHNQKFYSQADMSLSPMVLDWDEPTSDVKDAFLEFSPDGFATIVMDLHNTGGKPPKPHVWKGMPVMELINSACNFHSVEEEANLISNSIPYESSKRQPPFYLFRIIWTSPSQVIKTMDLVKKERSDLDIVITDPYNFFRLFKEYLQSTNLDVG